MTIHFIGLSCFLIENKKGYRIVIDPFNDTPEWTLGPRFPSSFNDTPFGANVVLISEPDADHARDTNGWLQHAPATTPDSDPFPGLDLKGTIIHEWNGDLNIAWHYTVDGVRCAHFADLAHELNEQQRDELGHPDIIMLPMPKVDSQKEDVLLTVKKNIEHLRPKLIIPAHHIAPADLPHTDQSDKLRAYFKDYFKNFASTNKSYRGNASFIELCYVLENAYKLTKEYPSTMRDVPTLEISRDLLTRTRKKPAVLLFRAMLATSKKYK